LNLVVTSESSDVVHSITCRTTDTVAHVATIVATQVSFFLFGSVGNSGSRAAGR